MHRETFLFHCFLGSKLHTSLCRGQSETYKISLQ
uniref:Uncharacterized protein n=1 Tax=Setaria italica TaxID=4555 RepID=K4ANM2_SETIT